MFSSLTVFGLLSFSFVTATPVAKRQAWFPPWDHCKTCFLSSWTQGSECKTDKTLLSTISRIVNPPAEATSTFTPTQWCSDLLRQTDWSTAYSTSPVVSTYTDWTITHILITATDFDHPTSTISCPIPSSGMECGYDSNTIAPIEQGEDWSIERNYDAAGCQQVCLSKPLCKAYRLQDGKSQCEIFNVGLGKGASNVINPTPNGSQWWDRNCQKHVPTSCSGAAVAAATPIQTTNAVITSPSSAVPSQSFVTPTSTAVPQNEARGLEKRYAKLPPYLADLEYFYSYIYVEPACSCLISSALPPTSSTTTSIVTSWTGTTTVKTTFVDIFTVTETPRETTVYKSVN